MKTEEEIRKKIKEFDDYKKDLPSKSRGHWARKINQLKWVLDEN